MRRRKTGGGVTVQAVAGNHAVFFGFDLTAAARHGCLGFAIHRTDHTEDERYWLSGFKTFESVVPLPDPDTIYSSRDHPLQTFYWGDYTAKPGHDYSYRVVPRYGTPKNLVDKAGSEVTIDISTSDPAEGVHGIYFNRGVAASQAYVRKFGAPPDELKPAKRAAALKWLSRGLIEAILAFIAQAGSAKFALRAAVYEFTQQDVLAAFRAASDQGADVKIVYHALDDSTGTSNRNAIDDAGLNQAILIPRTNARLAHNKFIVLCHKDGGELTPVSVWTGSTNLSEGGIYGHSNVGHAVRDAEIAQRFLSYWSTLADHPELDALRDWVTEHSVFDAAAVTTDGIDTIFSPRHGQAPLKWYAQQFGGGAETAAYITEAFGMNKLFEDALASDASDALHYVSLDKVDDHQADWSASRKVFVAVGSSGGPDELSRWAAEQLTGFNHHVPYLHTKILLIDPLSESPTVISGSANFSPNSTNGNDENMLVIAGDTEVADVYLTEFARIFNHFYARWWASQLNEDETEGGTHSFLDETEGWQAAYFTAKRPKQLQRTLYSSLVQGNAPA